MLNTRSKYCLTAALSLSVMSFSSLATPVICGPGPHWIDDCPAGVAVTPAAMKVQVRIPCDNLTTPTLVLRGAVKIKREAGTPGVPAAPGEPGDATHFIATNTLSLRLTGRGIRLRTGTKQGITPPALGEIHELPSDPNWAWWYADYYYEVDIPRLGTLHANDVCRMQGFIDQIPPPHLTKPQPWEYPCTNMEDFILPLYDDYEVEVGCLVTGGLD